MSSWEQTWLEHARLYVLEMGYSVIPMGRNKRPLTKWKQYQTRRPSEEEMLWWEKQNLAIITGAISGIVCVDCESVEDARWCWRNLAPTKLYQRTRRGIHLIYRHVEPVRNGQRVQGHYDVRGDGGYFIAPPSRHAEGQYRWMTPLVRTAELTAFRPQWRPDTISPETPDRVIRHAEQYIRHIRAVSGQGGHNATWRAVVILRDSGMSQAAAMLTLAGWNKTNADPPWSERELLHKVESCYGGAA